MQKIIDIIKYENESHKVDFKKVEYNLGKFRNKNEILKDFLSFANNISDDDKYIIIGVKELENKSKDIFDIESPTDEAKYRQFINEYIEPQVNFEYNNFTYEGKNICFFRLFNNADRPYLIKKDCKNPVGGKTDFRYGDGFIRVGTSTKKIGRKELDDIEKCKIRYINRHNDIVTHPTIGNSDNEEVSRWNIKYLDLKIENTSNQSIDLDVEMIIKKSKEYTIIKETEFLRKIQEAENKANRTNNPYSISFKQINAYFPDIHINTRETDNSFVIERNPINRKSAISIPQNSTYSDVFRQSILLLEKTNNKIEVEIIIKSDDFKNGSLKKTLIFET